MLVKDRQGSADRDDTASLGGPAAGIEALLGAVPLARLVDRRPILRLAAGRAPMVAAERLIVSRRTLAAELGAGDGQDDELLRHAADLVAERLVRHALHRDAPAPFPGLPARVPVLVSLPLRPFLVPAPRPGLVGVLPLAAAAAPLAPRRAELAALGWRLGVDGLDAVALRVAAPAAIAADLLLLRWSPDLPGVEEALRGVDRHALLLTGCDGPEAVAWGCGAGLSLFGGPGAEALLPPDGRAG